MKNAAVAIVLSTIFAGIGQLKAGYDADILIFNEDIEIQKAFVKGNCVYTRK